MDFHEQLSGREALASGGRVTLVTCAQCGCRLRPEDDGSSDAWYHFAPLGGRDARGCRIDCSEAAHDKGGMPLAVLA